MSARKRRFPREELEKARLRQTSLYIEEDSRKPPGLNVKPQDKLIFQEVGQAIELAA
jgi:hypothetical protein